MKLIYPADEKTNDAIATWVMKQFDRRATRPYRAIGLLNDNERLVAGVVFNGYNGANVDLTAYAPGLFSRRALRGIFRFAFMDLQATRITARTRRKNPLHTKQILKRLGFVYECLAPRYYDTGKAGDAMVYRMLRGDCPWIGELQDGRYAQGARSGGHGRSAGEDEPRDGCHANRP